MSIIQPTHSTWYYIKVDKEGNSSEEMEFISSDEEVEELGNKGDPFKRVKWYYPDLCGRDAEAILRTHQINGSYLLRSNVPRQPREGAPASNKEYSLHVWCEKQARQFRVEYRSENGSVKFGLMTYGSVKEFDTKMRRGYRISNGVYDIFLKNPIPNISEPSITKEKDFEYRITKLSGNENVIYPGQDVNLTTRSATYSSEKVNYEVHSGYLIKQGHLFKSWKKRWFTLKQNNLTYYKDNTSQSAIKTINLDTIQELIENDHNYKRKNCFTIVSREGYRLTMEAENYAEYRRWIEKLSRSLI